MCGGIVNNLSWLSNEIKRLTDEQAIIYAVDSGANVLYDLGVVPNVFVGDADSVCPRVKEYVTTETVEVLKFNPEKDNTDTELALKHAADLGATEVVCYAASGGRQDHFIANLFMLELSANMGVNASIVDENNRICYMDENCEEKLFDFSGYKYLSLLPISDTVEGLNAANLKYPVENLTLERASSRGVSNEFIGEDNVLKISKGSGRLFIVASNDGE